MYNKYNYICIYMCTYTYKHFNQLQKLLKLLINRLDSTECQCPCTKYNINKIRGGINNPSRFIK